ncbi:hypothetical protein VNO78_32118 [Psophocarpus tetragonolobus]|uniref:Uncharacterized protein n=1 Tax=Psophocarpus tetragonolobus TaxID=3891 RepID=A0AAN9RYZ9_PSOTE
MINGFIFPICEFQILWTILCFIKLAFKYIGFWWVFDVDMMEAYLVLTVNYEFRKQWLAAYVGVALALGVVLVCSADILGPRNGKFLFDSV